MANNFTGRGTVIALSFLGQPSDQNSTLKDPPKSQERGASGQAKEKKMKGEGLLIGI